MIVDPINTAIISYMHYEQGLTDKCMETIVGDKIRSLKIDNFVMLLITVNFQPI